MTAQRIGRLRHRVRIEQPVRSEEEGGAATITWQTLATVWASLDAVRGTEAAFAHKPTARATYNATMRYRDDVDATMRIIAGNRTFEIISAADVDGRHQWLTCLCELQGP